MKQWEQLSDRSHDYDQAVSRGIQDWKNGITDAPDLYRNDSNLLACWNDGQDLGRFDDQMEIEERRALAKIEAEVETFDEYCKRVDN